jgi:hypothetical protein
MSYRAKVRDRKTGLVIDEKEFNSRDEAESWAIDQGESWPDTTRYNIEEGPD